MSRFKSRAISLAVIATAFAAGLSVPVWAQSTPPAAKPGLAAEQPFLSGNSTAMDRMMAGMAIKPTGNIDKDFVDMMVPHHQGAIDMAVLELRYGHNLTLKALAQEIIVTQQQEIAAMRQAVGEPLPPSKPSPVSPGPSCVNSR